MPVVGVGFIALTAAILGVVMAGVFAGGDEPLRPCLMEQATQEAEDDDDEDTDQERLQMAEQQAEAILENPATLKGDEQALVSFGKETSLSDALAVLTEVAPGSRVIGVHYDLLDACKMRHSINITVREDENPQDKVQAFLPHMLESIRESAGETTWDATTNQQATKDYLLAQRSVRDDQARLRGLRLEISSQDLLNLLRERHELGIAAVEVFGANAPMFSPAIVGED